MRFGKMPSSCLCFCKARPESKRLAFLVGCWLGLASSWLSGWLSGWLGLAHGWLSGWFGLAPGWFGLAHGWLSGWFGLGLVWLLADFLAVWFGSWLAFWLVWLGFLFFPVFLARLAETQLLGILQAYLGIILTSARSLSSRIESIWDTL